MIRDIVNMRRLIYIQLLELDLLYSLVDIDILGFDFQQYKLRFHRKPIDHKHHSMYELNDCIIELADNQCYKHMEHFCNLQSYYMDLQYRVQLGIDILQHDYC